MDRRLQRRRLEGTLFTLAWFLSLPGFLLTLLSSAVLGVTLVVKRFRPTLPALLLALLIPLAFGITEVTSMGSAALPVMLAYGILGRRIAGAASTPTPQHDRSWLPERPRNSSTAPHPGNPPARQLGHVPRPPIPRRVTPQCSTATEQAC